MISLVLTIIICVFLEFLYYLLSKNENNGYDTEIHDELSIKINDEFAMDEKYLWQLEIPKINLIAPIAEGIDTYTLNKYIGHFPTTSIDSGNIGLAGHNRGYQKNYFERLKELQIGDIIIYKTEDKKKEYKVDIITIIEDTDWSYLKSTEDNRITLITCVENEPSKRRCVQGEEI